MDRPKEASRCRQRIAESLSHLARLAHAVQGRESMIRASLYRYRRRCGTSGCRCERGALHEGRALSVSDGRRSHPVSLAGLDLAEVERQVEAYRQWRQTRAKIVRSFAEFLEAGDELARLRTVPLRHGVRTRSR